MRQDGAAVLLLMLIVVMMGVAYFLTGSVSIARQKIENDKRTAQALAQAKEALIGFAITYGDTHHGNVEGYLPCPDLSGTAIGGEGGAEGNCGAENVSILGRLPWKTLGLPPLKDGNGNCLWYAVSGTYKYNPKTDLMNWDNNGLFQIVASDGVSFLAGSTPDNQAVAVIFAPGAAMGSQSHASVSGTPTCGGNYIASNYLDNDPVHGINNAAVSPIANAVTRFVAGPVGNISGNEIVNDHVIFITRSDLFNAIKKRKDFEGFVNGLLTEAISNLSTLPAPGAINFSTSPVTETAGGTIVGSLNIGRVPGVAATGNYFLENWQDNLLYGRCTSGFACLTVNAVPCRGVVIFSGERESSQGRGTNAQKNEWSNYLESAVYRAFTTGDVFFSGAQAYSTTSTSTDLLACIP